MILKQCFEFLNKILLSENQIVFLHKKEGEFY
jgi:hypothetical protein